MDNIIKTPKDEILNHYRTVSESYATGKTLAVTFRKHQLKQFWKLVDENEELLRECLYKDLRKPLVEGQGLEISLFKNEIVHLLESLDKYLEPEKPYVPEAFQGLTPTIHKQPKGVCLVIGAWNYPMFLTASPFLGVIASGCTGIMKPPEQAPHTAAALTSLVPKYLDTSCYAVVNGAAAEVTTLLGQRWNHIFYTGGARVGTIIATAAARNLTPVTLELGGKCPVIVTQAADIPLAAKRVAWGKFACAGQTCVAPDYALVHKDVHDSFVAAISAVVKDFYGSDPSLDGHMARMVNSQHWDRATTLLRQSKGKVVFGGVDASKREDLYIAPTVVCEVALDDALMSDEIFAPILPILKYDTLSEACQTISKVFSEPLGLYVMSESQADYDFVLSNTISGGVTLNDVMTQIAVPNLPFGGFGGSGFGSYHGKASIDTFSHRRSVVSVPKEAEEGFEWRYPSGDQKAKWNFFKSNLEAKL